MNKLNSIRLKWKAINWRQIQSAALVVTSIASFCILLFFVAVFFFPGEKLELFDKQFPITDKSKEVGPNDTVQYIMQYCTKQDIRTEVTRTLEGPETYELNNGEPQPLLILRGCGTTVYNVPIPSDVIPGTYRIKTEGLKEKLPLYTVTFAVI